jgi:hypothetical protein
MTLFALTFLVLVAPQLTAPEFGLGAIGAGTIGAASGEGGAAPATTTSAPELDQRDSATTVGLGLEFGGDAVAPITPPASATAPSPSVAFEDAPGVLSVSLRTRRKDALKAYPTEAIGAMALGLEDLRLTPSNKDGRLEVNLGEQIRY